MKRSLISAAIVFAIGPYGYAHAADTSPDISGVVEVEMTEENIAVSTVELGFSQQINDTVSAEMSFLYEGDTTDVDVAAITIAPKESGWSIITGQFYTPFGSFDSNMISDPLTLAIGETRANAIQLGYEAAGFDISAYTASSATSLDTNGYKLTYSYENNSVSFGLGIGSTNDLSKSGGIDSTDMVAGQSLIATMGFGGLNLIYENIAADAAFTTGILTGQQPTATNIELAYSFKLGGKETTLALGSQTSEQASVLLAKSRTIFGLSSEIMPGTSLSLEYNEETDYASTTTSATTAKLAVEF